ncbi:hypothetical protein AV530_003520 [Patagioenas fasciata monilis]|uniref:Uncharacterized protein n=1 Tax=Patagioenas fasciata monilis TaxID=372326 RepID=A0A1V4K2X8_PATFA|nr:hypothetical protein AV530_003520 [Patagioenas fasciata monilis]
MSRCSPGKQELHTSLRRHSADHHSKPWVHSKELSSEFNPEWNQQKEAWKLHRQLRKYGRSDCSCHCPVSTALYCLTNALDFKKENDLEKDFAQNCAISLIHQANFNGVILASHQCHSGGPSVIQCSFLSIDDQTCSPSAQSQFHQASDYNKRKGSFSTR